MGLDMSLNGRRFIRSWGLDNEDEIADKVAAALPETLPPGSKPEYVEVEFVRWRKANAIHKWFVDNVQDGNDDCRHYDLHWEQIAELRDTCKKVIDNPDMAQELLPVASGFFFGSTEYDDYYMQDIEYTMNALTDLITWYAVEKLADRKYFWDLQYYSSW